MIGSVGTLYAIQDPLDHLETHSVTREDFLEGFLKYGSSTSAAVYDSATKLSWIVTGADGVLIPDAARQGSTPWRRSTHEIAIPARKHW